MSYDTSTRKKAKPAEQQVSLPTQLKSLAQLTYLTVCSQALLPDALRQANVQIEGQLTKYQNNLRQLIQMVSTLTPMRASATTPMYGPIWRDIDFDIYRKKRLARKKTRMSRNYAHVSMTSRGKWTTSPKSCRKTSTTTAKSACPIAPNASSKRNKMPTIAV